MGIINLNGSGGITPIISSYTPTIVSAEGSYNLNPSEYNTLNTIRVGDLMTVQGYLDIVSANDPTGDIYISQPPGVESKTDYIPGSSCIRNFGGLLENNVVIYTLPLVIPFAPSFGLMNVDDDGTGAPLSYTDVDTAWGLRLSITYEVIDV